MITVLSHKWQHKMVRFAGTSDHRSSTMFIIVAKELVDGGHDVVALLQDHRQYPQRGRPRFVGIEVHFQVCVCSAFVALFPLTKEIE